MKRIWTTLILAVFVLAFVGSGWGEEDFPPPADNKGVIGNSRTGEAWRLGQINRMDMTEVSAPSGDPSSNHGWLYVKDNAATSALYFEDDGGTVVQLGTGAATAWDDIGNPDADKTITFDNDEVTVFSFADVNEDMFTIKGVGAFGDVSIVKIEQSTGAATDGTVLEVVSADANVDPLVVSANGVANAFVVGQDGTVTTASDLTVGGDLAVTGTWNVNAITASTATQTLALNGETTGGVSIGVTSTGNVTLGDDVVVSDGYNVTVGEGTLTVDNDAVDEDSIVVTSSATAAGNALDITAATTSSKAVTITASAVSSGDALYIACTEATLAGGGNYIQLYDGGATDWKVARYGATTIAGNASTDVLTLTAGDIQVTSGDIDVDNGQIMVDTTQDLASNISRNFAGAGSAALMTINEDNTNSTSIALSINNDGTGNATGISIVHDGDLPALIITAGAARTGNVIDIAMANQVAQNGLLIDGAWTGASDIGMINLNPSGSIAAGASALRIDTDTGTPGASGFGIEIDDDSVDGGTFYALLINSANNEGLHVEAGLSLFAELATFTAGIDTDAGVDMDTATIDVHNNFETTQVGNTAGLGFMTIHGNHAGNTNDAPLLRLVYQGDNDAQDTFILLEDNSTGAAGNGDDQLKIGAGGDIIMGGATGTGGKLIYSFEDLTVESGGTAASIEVITSIITTNGDGDEDAVTLADGTKGQIKIFVSAVEGAGGDSYKVTPDNMNGGTKITFDGAVGDGCTFLFDGTSWNVISNNGGVIS